MFIPQHVLFELLKLYRIKLVTLENIKLSKKPLLITEVNRVTLS